MTRRNRAAAAAFPLLAAMAAMAATARGHEGQSRVSVDSSGAEGDGRSGATAAAAISSNGRYVAFESEAGNLVGNDLNSVSDVFVRDRVAGVTIRVSVDSSGVEANGGSFAPALSGDGRFVAFHSDADNLIASDTNGVADVFVHDRDPDGNGVFDEGNGETKRVSVKSDGTHGNGRSRFPSISSDGAKVVFASEATNLVDNDNNRVSDVFLHDRGAGTTTRVSVSSAGVEGDGDSRLASISPGGAFVGFQSLATNLVASDGNGRADVFVRDLAGGVTSRVSVDSSGTEGNNHSFGPPALSTDGAFVAFWSLASNLVTSDTNSTTDIFVRQISTGSTTRVSVTSSGAQVFGGSRLPAISGDGRIVAFESDASDLVPGDVNGARDIFLRDRAASTTTLVTVNCVGVQADGASILATVSSDGQLVAFSSDATNLVAHDRNAVTDVILLDRAVSDTDASWRNYGAGYPGKNGIPGFTASADPVIGTSLSLLVDNSRAAWTVGFVLVGWNSASIPTSSGGTLLVDFAFIEPVALPPGGGVLPIDIPVDPAVCGFAAYFQVVEIDPGARYGLSFTPGLELICGH